MSIDDTLDIEARLQDTRRAFDSVAADYDGPLGNNELIQRMRAQMWRTLTTSFAAGARLLDIGCGTGLDAVHLAGQGYAVVATDWSPRMIECTQARAARSGLSDWIEAHTLGAQDVMQLRGQSFDGIYSDFGALNCVPNLQVVAEACAALLKPGGRLVVSVIGRNCPWEFVYYAARGNMRRARLRQTPGCVPVSLNHQTVWTQYYAPRDFYRAFANDFTLTSYRGLSLFLPPPYLLRDDRLWRAVYGLLGWLDDRLGGWPGLRNMGDHFLMVLTKRA